MRWPTMSMQILSGHGRPLKMSSGFTHAFAVVFHSSGTLSCSSFATSGWTVVAAAIFRN